MKNEMYDMRELQDFINKDCSRLIDYFNGYTYSSIQSERFYLFVPADKFKETYIIITRNLNEKIKVLRENDCNLQVVDVNAEVILESSIYPNTCVIVARLRTIKVISSTPSS